MTWILVFFLLADPDHIGMYAGDENNVSMGRPREFASKDECLKVLASQKESMDAQHEQKPELGDFQLECRPTDVRKPAST